VCSIFSHHYHHYLKKNNNKQIKDYITYSSEKNYNLCQLNNQNVLNKAFRYFLSSLSFISTVSREPHPKSFNYCASFTVGLNKKIFNQLGVHC
jgi:hypothetical protein